jgi:hypothetical protein
MKKEKKYAAMTDAATDIASGPASAYNCRPDSYDLFDEAGNRQFYTLDEFAEKLAKSFNNNLGTDIKL